MKIALILAFGEALVRPLTAPTWTSKQVHFLGSPHSLDSKGDSVAATPSSHRRLWVALFVVLALIAIALVSIRDT